MGAYVIDIGPVLTRIIAAQRRNSRVELESHGVQKAIRVDEEGLVVTKYVETHALHHNSPSELVNPRINTRRNVHDTSRPTDLFPVVDYYFEMRFCQLSLAGGNEPKLRGVLERFVQYLGCDIVLKMNYLKTVTELDSSRDVEGTTMTTLFSRKYLLKSIII